MKNVIYLMLVLVAFSSCKKEDKKEDIIVDPPISTEKVIPVNINDKGLDLLENMQGHWVGRNQVMAWDFEWFAFDYRAISPSHTFGIFEGGTMGNLFTSFFVTDYKNTRTIMARNGGLLNGIYRTSYFVLDSVDYSDGDFYRLIDAKGGTDIMWMELRFKNDSIYFNAYTSRLGLVTPIRHMTFKAKKGNVVLAEQAAMLHDFPKNELAWEYEARLKEEFYYIPNGETEAKTATFLSEGIDTDVITLAHEAGDPIRIDEHPSLAYLELNIERNSEIEDSNLFAFLSYEALTDENGYMKDDFGSVLLFPELNNKESKFLFTYLHPGEYYITIIADKNEDGFASAGDISHPSILVTIDPKGQHSIEIDNINVQN